MDLVVSPVGADSDLRAALEDLKLGRYLAARNLFSRTGSHWALRTSRSQLLAAGVGEAGVFFTWRNEEPNSAHALMMWARALTRAAVEAYHNDDDHRVVARAAALARQACWKAADLWPACPVPWICLLHLTQLSFAARDFDPYAHTRPSPWDRLEDPTMPFPGPWPILAEIKRRHPGSREGHHRMREYFLRRGGGPGIAMQYSAWLVSSRTPDPQLLMLPLYSLMDLYRERHSKGGSLQFWLTEQVGHYARRAWDDWFVHVPPAEYSWVPLSDLSHLAHALVACGETERAAWVFNAMGPHVTPQPWKDINASLGRSRDWRDEFLRIRASVVR
ncbi:hypothetical protein [Streptomyces sp. H51]|uniref:hypothetical protein n=1 Tax=Streptomyces sp. H51 TaxID=3111770 RepID=UPI002D79EE2D|nr:hypothetical protein [Streptomyces sp. H51]